MISILKLPGLVLLFLLGCSSNPETQKRAQEIKSWFDSLESAKKLLPKIPEGTYHISDETDLSIFDSITHDSPSLFTGEVKHDIDATITKKWLLLNNIPLKYPEDSTNVIARLESAKKKIG